MDFGKLFDDAVDTVQWFFEWVGNVWDAVIDKAEQTLFNTSTRQWITNYSEYEKAVEQRNLNEITPEQFNNQIRDNWIVTWDFDTRQEQLRNIAEEASKKELWENLNKFEDDSRTFKESLMNEMKDLIQWSDRETAKKALEYIDNATGDYETNWKNINASYETEQFKKEDWFNKLNTDYKTNVATFWKKWIYNLNEWKDDLDAKRAAQWEDYNLINNFRSTIDDASSSSSTTHFWNKADIADISTWANFLWASTSKISEWMNVVERLGEDFLWAWAYDWAWATKTSWGLSYYANTVKNITPYIVPEIASIAAASIATEWLWWALRVWTLLNKVSKPVRVWANFIWELAQDTLLYDWIVQASIGRWLNSQDMLENALMNIPIDWGIALLNKNLKSDLKSTNQFFEDWSAWWFGDIVNNIAFNTDEVKMIQEWDYYLAKVSATKRAMEWGDAWWNIATADLPEAIRTDLFNAQTEVVNHFENINNEVPKIEDQKFFYNLQIFDSKMTSADNKKNIEQLNKWVDLAYDKLAWDAITDFSAKQYGLTIRDWIKKWIIDEDFIAKAIDENSEMIAKKQKLSPALHENDAAWVELAKAYVGLEFNPQIIKDTPNTWAALNRAWSILSTVVNKNIIQKDLLQPGQSIWRFIRKANWTYYDIIKWASLKKETMLKNKWIGIELSPVNNALLAIKNQIKKKETDVHSVFLTDKIRSQPEYLERYNMLLAHLWLDVDPNLTKIAADILSFQQGKNVTRLNPREMAIYELIHLGQAAEKWTDIIRQIYKYNPTAGVYELTLKNVNKEAFWNQAAKILKDWDSDDLMIFMKETKQIDANITQIKDMWIIKTIDSKIKEANPESLNKLLWGTAIYLDYKMWSNMIDSARYIQKVIDTIVDDKALMDYIETIWDDATKADFIKNIMNNVIDRNKDTLWKMFDDTIDYAKTYDTLARIEWLLNFNKQKLSEFKDIDSFIAWYIRVSEANKFFHSAQEWFVEVNPKTWLANRANKETFQKLRDKYWVWVDFKVFDQMQFPKEMQDKIQVYLKDKTTWWFYMNNVIYLIDMSDEIVFHEFAHHITKYLDEWTLSKIKTLYKRDKTLWKEYAKDTLAEYIAHNLADAFMWYNKTNNIFYKVIEFIKELSSKINSYFTGKETSSFYFWKLKKDILDWKFQIKRDDIFLSSPAFKDEMVLYATKQINDYKKELSVKELQSIVDNWLKVLNSKKEWLAINKLSDVYIDMRREVDSLRETANEYSTDLLYQMALGIKNKYERIIYSSMFNNPDDVYYQIVLDRFKKDFANLEKINWSKYKLTDDYLESEAILKDVWIDDAVKHNTKAEAPVLMVQQAPEQSGLEVMQSINKRYQYGYTPFAFADGSGWFNINILNTFFKWGFEWDNFFKWINELLDRTFKKMWIDLEKDAIVAQSAIGKLWEISWVWKLYASALRDIMKWKIIQPIKAKDLLVPDNILDMYKEYISASITLKSDDLWLADYIKQYKLNNIDLKDRSKALDKVMYQAFEDWKSYPEVVDIIRSIVSIDWFPIWKVINSEAFNATCIPVDLFITKNITKRILAGWGYTIKDFNKSIQRVYKDFIYKNNNDNFYLNVLIQKLKSKWLVDQDILLTDVIWLLGKADYNSIMKNIHSAMFKWDLVSEWFILNMNNILARIITWLDKAWWELKTISSWLINDIKEWLSFLNDADLLAKTGDLIKPFELTKEELELFNDFVLKNRLNVLKKWIDKDWFFKNISNEIREIFGRRVDKESIGRITLDSNISDDTFAQIDEIIKELTDTEYKDFRWFHTYDTMNIDNMWTREIIEWFVSDVNKFIDIKKKDHMLNAFEWTLKATDPIYYYPYNYKLIAAINPDEALKVFSNFSDKIFIKSWLEKDTKTLGKDIIASVKAINWRDMEDIVVDLFRWDYSDNKELGKFIKDVEPTYIFANKSYELTEFSYKDIDNIFGQQLDALSNFFRNKKNAIIEWTWADEVLFKINLKWNKADLEVKAANIKENPIWKFMTRDIEWESVMAQLTEMQKELIAKIQYYYKKEFKEWGQALIPYYRNKKLSKYPKELYYVGKRLSKVSNAIDNYYKLFWGRIDPYLAKNNQLIFMLWNNTVFLKTVNQTLDTKITDIVDVYEYTPIAIRKDLKYWEEALEYEWKWEPVIKLWMFDSNDEYWIKEAIWDTMEHAEASYIDDVDLTDLDFKAILKNDKWEYLDIYVKDWHIEEINKIDFDEDFVWEWFKITKEVQEELATKSKDEIEEMKDFSKWTFCEL